MKKIFNLRTAAIVLAVSSVTSISASALTSSRPGTESLGSEQTVSDNKTDVDELTKLTYLLYFDPTQLDEAWDGDPSYTPDMKKRMTKAGILTAAGKSTIKEELTEDQYLSADFKNTLNKKNATLKYSEPFSTQTELWGGSDHLASNMNIEIVDINFTSPGTADVNVIWRGKHTSPVKLNFVKENGVWKLNDIDNFKDKVAKFKEPVM